jgi:hypothetical protein
MDRVDIATNFGSNFIASAWMNGSGLFGAWNNVHADDVEACPLVAYAAPPAQQKQIEKKRLTPA